MDAAQVKEHFLKWHKPVRTWLRDRLGVPQSDLDDLTQEVFERLLRYDSRDLVQNPAGYLFKIATNAANERADRCRVKWPHSSEWIEELQVENGDTLDQEQRDALVRRYLSTLSKRQEDFIILHSMHRMTYKQIANLRNTSYRIVLRELSKAYSELRFKFSSDPDLAI